MREYLNNYQKENRCTLLGVGPMSKNCTDAAVELSNEYEIPIFLIASRRQIDSKDFGGGYVNNWSTEVFSKYVLNKDKKNKIYLSRDHGGPWQNAQEKEKKLSLKDAMESAKKSYKVDIESGFKIIHLDPSIDIHNKPTIDQILDRLFELYEYCFQIAEKANKEILFEVGTEEQTGSSNTIDEFEYTLRKIYSFCSKNNLPKPTFVVAQTGTKVMERRNVGSFDQPLRVVDEMPPEIQIPKILDICKNFNIMLKQHNTDYLSDESLFWHPRLGIHSANIAPEFGVAETLALLKTLEENNLKSISEKIIELSYESNKWKKWMIPENKTDEREKAIIAGHYIFSNKDFIELKHKAILELKLKNLNLDTILTNAIKSSIFRYMRLFRLIKR